MLEVLIQRLETAAAIADIGSFIVPNIPDEKESEGLSKLDRFRRMRRIAPKTDPFCRIPFSVVSALLVELKRLDRINVALFQTATKIAIIDDKDIAKGHIPMHVTLSDFEDFRRALKVFSANSPLLKEAYRAAEEKLAKEKGG